ncbi:hypothetical protein FEM48_ZijujUnG0039500 [Ziziphus jujuba var. spinosa]|uniref:Bifunctional inhibitor/plant lipid transfer protein/seed storage helical domain-containing protein n=1 Tax=Ziziphus jujuba var. spinosa TaxID=714518 RepID=A0A978U9E3_ZIZJJ|nr:hypothetical protein FEM48_ZijujUnG0039500 [Ziziphus jujuba var. spinosa]
MVVAGGRGLCFTVSLMAGMLVMGNSGVRAQCEARIPSLIAQCGKYVSKSGPQTLPSKRCCTVEKSLDIPCVCNLVTKEIEKLISMDKAVFVGSKLWAGRYTVPNALGRDA